MGIVLCFLPLLAGLLIFSFGFKLKITHQLLAVLLGLIAVLPISIIQYFFPSIPILSNYPAAHALIKSLILYGFIEELFKLLLLFPLPKKDYSIFSFLMLSFIMGLSLGCFESAVYFFDHLQKATSRGAQLLYSPIFLRIFTSDMIHMFCTGLCGLCMYSIKQGKIRISFFFWAVAIHGLYDFFAGFNNYLRFFSIAVILLSLAECRIGYTKLKESLEKDS